MKWDESQLTGVTTEFDEIYDMIVFNDALYVSGVIEDKQSVAKFNGTKWENTEIGDRLQTEYSISGPMIVFQD